MEPYDSTNPTHIRYGMNMTDITQSDYRGPGSPSYRMEWLLAKLEAIFPGVVDKWSSAPQDHLLIEQVERLKAKVSEYEKLHSIVAHEVVAAHFGDTPVHEGIRLVTPEQAWYYGQYEAYVNIETKLQAILEKNK